MKSLILITLLIFSYGAIAKTYEGGIHSIIRGQGSDPHLIKFNSGLVKFIEQDESDKLVMFESQFYNEQDASESIVHNKLFSPDEPEFEPTMIADKDIGTIFNRMNPYMRRKSECSDRAHVWSWDEWQKSGIKSQKAFLLLTDTYIKRTRFKWWFHVAPMYTTKSGKKMVTDYQFLDHPVTFTEWKNLLVKSKRDCVTDFRFLDYNAGADQTQDCYVKFEPMYYRLPGDIGASETGKYRTSWNTSEVNSARSRAFFKVSK